LRVLVDVLRDSGFTVNFNVAGHLTTAWKSITGEGETFVLRLGAQSSPVSSDASVIMLWAETRDRVTQLRYYVTRGHSGPTLTGGPEWSVLNGIRNAVAAQAVRNPAAK
jgi:hypothetical protein